MKQCLLVDDSGTIRALLKIHLSGMGLEFHEATDGKEALDNVQIIKPDLIIADQQMPSLDGIDFVKALREMSDERLKRTPVILLTGSKELKTSNDARKAGVNHFMRKPIDGPALKSAVLALLRAT